MIVISLDFFIPWRSSWAVHVSCQVPLATSEQQSHKAATRTYAAVRNMRRCVSDLRPAGMPLTFPVVWFGGPSVLIANASWGVYCSFIPEGLWIRRNDHIIVDTSSACQEQGVWISQEVWHVVISFDINDKHIYIHIHDMSSTTCFHSRSNCPYHSKHLWPSFLSSAKGLKPCLRQGIVCIDRSVR